jgi:hypothetical protein
LLDPVRGKSKVTGALIKDGFPGVPTFIEGPTVGSLGSTTDKKEGTGRAVLAYGVAGVRADASGGATSSGTQSVSLPLPKVWGMLNWREINNYQQLKNDPSKAQ